MLSEFLQLARNPATINHTMIKPAMRFISRGGFCVFALDTAGPIQAAEDALRRTALRD
jgi:hypothetical protein